MTLAGRLFAWFPAVHGACAFAAAVWALSEPGWGRVCFAGAVIYLFPLSCHAVLQRFAPLREGIAFLEERRFSPWWGSHQIQGLFIAFPALETVLRLVPGLYSGWLRAWGSRVGRGIHWTPNVEIADRSLLDIGDFVVFGHKVSCYAHVIKPRGGRLMLYARRLSIGDGAFLGAGSRLGPGSRVRGGAFVPMLTDVYPNRTFPADGAGRESESDAL